LLHRVIFFAQKLGTTLRLLRNCCVLKHVGASKY
jgi:hypothetical protein